MQSLNKLAKKYTNMRTFINKLSLASCLGIIAVLIFSFILPLYGQHVEQDGLFAGVSKINITPQTPIPMSGYGARKDPFKGVHDSIYVTATVFSDGIHKAAVITSDVLYFYYPFYDETVKKIEEVTGIKKEYVLLSSNHSHGGPVTRVYEHETAPQIEAYVNEVQNKIVKAVAQAVRNLQPAKIGMGKGICKMNINRRARRADGSIGLGRNPDGPCDHDVSVVRIDSRDGEPIAVMVNWPCHGTITGPDNYQITGDWPGAVARYVEKAVGHGVIVPVTAGASADINPIYGPNSKFGDIEATGMLLGEEVVRVFNTIETFPLGIIDAGIKTVTAEGKKKQESRMPGQVLEPDQDVPVNLAVLKVGDVVFAGISGELMTEIGMNIKKESPFKNTIVVTHCNGHCGYLCTDNAYPEGGYEIQVTHTMPGTEGLIEENFKNMIYTLK